MNIKLLGYTFLVYINYDLTIYIFGIYNLKIHK